MKTLETLRQESREIMTDYSRYRNAAKKNFDEYYASTFRTPPAHNDQDHIINVARSVMMTRDGLDSGGSFVQSIVENDLERTISRGDSVCVQHLPFFVYCKIHVHP